MAEKITFGEYVATLRKTRGYATNQFCRLLSLSPSFVSGMEHDKRPAPSPDIQRLIARVLELNDEEEKKLYDLAVKTKKKGTIPTDALDYINGDKEVLKFLRLAAKKHLTGKELLELIKG